MNFLKGIQKLKRPAFLKSRIARKRILKIFVSSPSDIGDAREEAIRQVERLNNDEEIAGEFQLEVLRWEESTPPIVGCPPQATVNDYTGRASEADIVICLFGRRFGTDLVLVNQHYPSGTYYEFKTAERAQRRNRTGKPVILLYRMLRDAPPHESSEDAEQAANVEAFFRKCRRFQGQTPIYEALYEEHRQVEDFGAALYHKLKFVIRKKFSRQSGSNPNGLLANRFGFKIDQKAKRADLIDRVRRDWIERASNKTNAGFAYPFDVRIRASKKLHGDTGSSASLHASSGDELLTIFDHVDHQLLLLGAAGAGKTFKLLELTNALLERAKENHSMPIPVLFNLSAWTGCKETMADWLVSQLVTVYHLPHKLARRWLDDEMLILCFDGLNEITVGGVDLGSHQEDTARILSENMRRACLLALNDYIAGTGIWMVLCCREKEYIALGTKLRARRGNTATIRIAPLSDEQVKAYLEKERWELESLRRAMPRDRTLRTTARNPFSLMAMTVAYCNELGNSVKGILGGGRGGKKARRMDLSGKYMRVRYTHAETALSTRWGLPEIQHFLEELDHKMEKAGSNLFFVEQVQPNWLPTPLSHWQYVGLVSLFLFLFITILVGLPAGAAIGLERALKTQSIMEGLRFGVMCSLATTVCCGSIIAVGFALTKTWGFGVACGLVVGVARGIIVGMSEESWATGLRVGLISAAAGIIVLAPLMQLRHHARDKILPLEGLEWDARKSMPGIVMAIIVCLVFWLSFDPARAMNFGIMLAAILALSFGYVSTGFEIKRYPNQGIQQSAMIALRTILLSAFIGMIGFGTGYGVAFGLREGIVNAILGLTLAVASLEFGAMPLIQHISLRFILAAYHIMPLRLVAFLEAACELHLLRRVGGGYSFQHEDLREYFRNSRLR